MTDKKSATEFEPKLGKPRSPSARKQRSFLGKVTRAINRAGSGKRGTSGAGWPSNLVGSRNGRGYVSGSLWASRSPQPGRRRVVVKARITLRGGQQTHEQAIFSHQQRAQIFIEPHAQFEKLATANGATWLDLKLLSYTPQRIGRKRFWSGSAAGVASAATMAGPGRLDGRAGR